MVITKLKKSYSLCGILIVSETELKRKINFIYHHYLKITVVNAIKLLAVAKREILFMIQAPILLDHRLRSHIKILCILNIFS